ncbi:MAG: polysaccharide deacetylase family protein [Halorhodospira sp.]
MRALVAIHDVMPETLARVEGLVERLRRAGHGALTLLVVPGRAWGPAELRLLRRWQAAGIELAAHGWSHHAPRWGGPWHRLHGALLSAGVAEHLALDGDGIAALMARAHAWFPRQGLAPPTTYVPPAWALGAVDRRRLAALPYRRVEVLSGVIDTRSGRLARLPLVGFEAGTVGAAWVLRGWNRLQWRRAQRQGVPLRVAIHPGDEALRLHRDLAAAIRQAPASMRSDRLPPAGGPLPP